MRLSRMGLLHTESSLGIQVRTSLTIHINHACDNTFIKTSITAISLRPARRRLRSRLVSQWKKKEPLVRRVDTNFSGVNFLAADNQVITFTFHGWGFNHCPRWLCADTPEMQSLGSFPSLTAFSYTSSSASLREPGLDFAGARCAWSCFLI